jgi:hypothetical protein
MSGDRVIAWPTFGVDLRHKALVPGAQGFDIAGFMSVVVRGYSTRPTPGKRVPTRSTDSLAGGAEQLAAAGTRHVARRPWRCGARACVDL